MGTILVTRAQADTIKQQLSTNAVKSAMKKAYEVNAVGVKPINNVLADAFVLLGDLNADYPATTIASITTTLAEDESVNNLAGWRTNPSGYNSSVTGNPMTESEIILYSMDVERVLLNHMLRVIADMKASYALATDKNEKKKLENYRKRAKKCAQDLIVHIAMGYKNLCHRLNPDGGTAVLDPTVNGAVTDVLKLRPDNDSCSDVVYEILTGSNFKSLVKDKVVQSTGGTLTLATELSEAERKAKKTKKRVKSHVFRDTYNALWAKKIGGDDYKDLYGVEKGQIVTPIVVVLATAMLAGGLLSARSCNGNEQVSTEAPETSVGEVETVQKPNPAESLGQSTEEGGQEDTGDAGDGGSHIYEDPAYGRDNDVHTGGSFTNPWVDGEFDFEEEEVEEETVVSDEPDWENPAEGLDEEQEPIENEGDGDMGWGRA